MPVVSNASPLINLSRIGKIDLLHSLFGNLVVPVAVWDEVVVEGHGLPGSELVRSCSWITKGEVKNAPLVHTLGQELDGGEAEAIVLALEMNADLLLMDERLGRETAQHLGIRCLGLIGVLTEAKRRKLIGQVKPAILALRDLAGFRISQTLFDCVLADLGET
jgi:predicted nucleic acid-binding protein